MSKKDAYETKLKGRLAEWQADIDKLKAKAEKASGETQVSYYEEIEKLQSQKEKTQDKLNDLRDASEDAWQDLKSGLDKAWNDLGDSIRKASNRFD